MIGRGIFFVCAMCLPIAAHAQGLPRQGTARYTDYSTLVVLKTMALGKDRIATDYEVYGVSRNDDGGDIFNNMAIRCLGSMITADGEITSRGFCIHADKDGDQLFIQYDNGGHVGAAYGGTEHFVGGTGKYTGIAGQANLTLQRVKAPDNSIMIILSHHATWTLP